MFFGSSKVKAKKEKVPPVMFKVDYTIDANKNVRIFELGHPFSNNSGLENCGPMLVKKLFSKYSHVYLSGDYSECRIIQANCQDMMLPKIPEYVELEALITIRTEDSIVIIRNYESPTYFTPFMIQKSLKETGSNLTVFNANPMACLMAYEKILIQRLQCMVHDSLCVPTTLINLSQAVSQQCADQNFQLNDDYYIVKPAFSSCQWGINVVAREKLMSHVEELQLQYHQKNPTQSYQRGPFNLLNMIFVGPPSCQELKDRSACYINQANQYEMRSLFSESSQVTYQVDPFILIQPIIRPCPIPTDDKKGEWLPTFRVFILIDQDDNSSHHLNIHLLTNPVALYPKKPYKKGQPITADEILAGVDTNADMPPLRLLDDYAAVLTTQFNRPNMKRFFAKIINNEINNEVNFLNDMIATYPELSAYYDAIKTYPPYHTLLNLPQDEITQQSLICYQNVSIFNKLEAMLIKIAQNRFLQINIKYYLPNVVTILSVYISIYQKDTEKNSSYLYTLLTNILTPALLTRTKDSTQDNLWDYLKIALGRLIIATYLLENEKFNKSLDISEYIKEFMCIFFKLYLMARFLVIYPATQENKELNQWMSQERFRNTVMDFSINLRRLEKNAIVLTDEATELKDRFHHWVNIYLQSIPVDNLLQQPPMNVL